MSRPRPVRSLSAPASLVHSSQTARSRRDHSAPADAHSQPATPSPPARPTVAPSSRLTARPSLFLSAIHVATPHNPHTEHPIPPAPVPDLFDSSHTGNQARG